MKRTFYELLGVRPDATVGEITAAYKQAAVRLDDVTIHGMSDAAMELNLLREGYAILSDPAQRARYDAKLLADASGVKLMFFAEGRKAKRSLGMQSVVFAVLATTLVGILYSRMTSKIDEVRVEHNLAVARQKDEKTRAIVIEPDQTSVIVSSGTRPSK